MAHPQHQPQVAEAEEYLATTRTVPTVHQEAVEEGLVPDLDPQATHPTIWTDTTVVAVHIGRHPTCPRHTTHLESIIHTTETSEIIIPEEPAMSLTILIAHRHRHQDLDTEAQIHLDIWATAYHLVDILLCTMALRHLPISLPRPTISFASRTRTRHLHQHDDLLHINSRLHLHLPVQRQVGR